MQLTRGRHACLCLFRQEERFLQKSCFITSESERKYDSLHYVVMWGNPRHHDTPPSSQNLLFPVPAIRLVTIFDLLPVLFGI